MHPKPEEMPPDAVLKFYKTIGVQDIVFRRDNVEYTLAMYWSPSEQTTYAPELPLELRQGGYG